MKPRAPTRLYPIPVQEKGILLAAGLSLVPFYVHLAILAGQSDPHVQDIAMQHDGIERRYLLHVPPDLDPATPAALVLCLHGGGGTADQMARFTGFSALSDEKGFLVVYPDSVGRIWEDGREGRALPNRHGPIDDVGFLSAVIDDVSRRHAVDPKRIFATGPSNGGFMSHRLGIELSNRIAAIAPVIGGIAEPLAERVAPAQPVSVLIIQGTEDPLVPYDGGNVRVGGRERGRLISTADAVKRWVAANGCAEPPNVEVRPDADPRDGCRVTVMTYTGGRAGSEVLLYRIDGGGHTWPGGSQYLPKRLIGRVCRDFDATRTIWEFFERHPKP